MYEEKYPYEQTVPLEKDHNNLFPIYLLTSVLHLIEFRDTLSRRASANLINISWASEFLLFILVQYKQTRIRHVENHPISKRWYFFFLVYSWVCNFNLFSKYCYSFGDTSILELNVFSVDKYLNHI